VSTFGGMAGAGIRAAVGAMLTLACAGCFQQTGDFGRRHDNLITGTLLPGAGSLLAGPRGEPVSAHPLTDDERELRDRSWRFLMPAHDGATLRMKLSELAYTRVLPPLQWHGREHYHATLMAGPFRSVASRYRRLADDIESDRQLVSPFTQTAIRVCQADRVRSNAIPHVTHLSDHSHHHALERIAENAMLTAWVRRDMALRAEAYRYALEHLVIEGPQREAIQAERALLALERDLSRLQRTDDCAVTPHAGGLPAEAGPRFAPASPAAVQERPPLPPK
jgi:hypothetical protein